MHRSWKKRTSPTGGEGVGDRRNTCRGVVFRFAEARFDLALVLLPLVVLPPALLLLLPPAVLLVAVALISISYFR
jgi:hypothetical protein